MPIRRLAAEGVLALCLVAAARGGSSGDGGSLSAPATDAAGTATEVVASDAAPLGEGSLDDCALDTQNVARYDLPPEN